MLTVIYTLPQLCPVTAQVQCGAAAAPQGLTITPVCGNTGITPVCNPQITNIPVVCGGAAAVPQGVTVTPVCGNTGATPICNATGVPIICHGGAAAAPQAVGCANATIHATLTTLPQCQPLPTAPAPGGCSGIQGGCQPPLTAPAPGGCSGIQGGCGAAPQGITALGLCDKTYVPAICGVTVASQAIGCTGVPVICNGAAAAPQAVGCANATVHPTITTLPMCAPTVQICPTPITAPAPGGCSGIQGGCQPPLTAPAQGGCSGIQGGCGAAPQGITALGICDVTIIPVVCGVTVASQAIGCTGVPVICNGAAAAPQAVGCANATVHPTITTLPMCAPTVQICPAPITAPAPGGCSGIQGGCGGAAAPQGITALGICQVTLVPALCVVTGVSQAVNCTGVPVVCNDAAAAPQALTVNTTVMTVTPICPNAATTTVHPTFICGQGAAAAPQAAGMHTAATLCTHPQFCAGTTYATVCTQIGCDGGAAAAPQAAGMHTAATLCTQPQVCAGTTLATVCTQLTCNDAAAAAPQAAGLNTWFHGCGIPPQTLTCPNPGQAQAATIQTWFHTCGVPPVTLQGCDQQAGGAAPQAVTGTINPIVCAASSVVGCTGIPIVC